MVRTKVRQFGHFPEPRLSGVISCNVPNGLSDSLVVKVMFIWKSHEIKSSLSKPGVKPESCGYSIQQRLYFRPLPHGQGAFLGILVGTP